MDIGTRKQGVLMYLGGNPKKSYEEGEGGGGTRFLFCIDHITSKRLLFIHPELYTNIAHLSPFSILNATLVNVAILAAILNFK